MVFSSSQSVIDGGISLQVDATADEKLSFEIGAADNISTGRYFVQLTNLGVLGGDDFADTPDEYDDFDTPVYSIGNSFTGTIGTLSDVDLQKVSLSAGQRYEAIVLGYADNEGTIALPEISLLSADGVLIGSGVTDLDAGRSTLSVGVIADGDYFIQISAKGFEGNVDRTLLRRLG